MDDVWELDRIKLYFLRRWHPNWTLPRLACELGPSLRNGSNAFERQQHHPWRCLGASRVPLSRASGKLFEWYRMSFSVCCRP